MPAPTPTPTADTEDFRRQAVELLVTEKLTVAEAARRRGVNAETLREWKRKYHPTPAPAVAPTPSVEQELRRLREENRQLKLEREILKQAATIVAREAS